MIPTLKVNLNRYCYSVCGGKFLRKTFVVGSQVSVIRGMSSATGEAGAGDQVLYSRQGSAQIVTLNRPKALNALTLEMVRDMTPRYKQFNEDPDVSCVVLQGAGDKAFCAGGDVVSMYKSMERDGDKAGLCRDFFYEEYHLDYMTATMQTPQVALLDGIVMGGGVGVSVHGPVRVATERSVFAMPETAIGFFCDVGGAYFLPRLRGQLGMCLALTGARLKGHQLKQAGVATHFITSDRLPAVVEALGQLPHAAVSVAQINDVLANFEGDESPGSEPPSESWSPVAESSAELVDRCFGQDSVEGVLAALDTEATNAGPDSAAGAWAHKTRQLLASLSPTALKVVFRQLREGGQLSLADCLRMEYMISQRFMVWGRSDFFEGVHAQLVAKKGDAKFRKPEWNPASLDQVDDALVDEFFRPQSTSQKECLVDSIWMSSSKL